MTETLDRIQSWPVDNAAGALLTPASINTSGDTSRVFELASVTKLLAAYGFLVAIEEGVFELDSPAGPAGATVRHLLAHASGVGFSNPEPERPVGERRLYSSAGFDILADYVATEAGMSFADYLSEAVFQPLGMESARLLGSAGHGAQASVADLVKFAAEVLDPRLISPETLGEATTVQFPDLAGIVPGYGRFNPCSWGLGFEIKGEKNPHWTGSHQPPATVGHFGQSGTFLWLDLAASCAGIVLTDRAFGEWAKPRWGDFNDDLWASATR
ncbi:serine hydrolase domain-containing protein [Corynebacterium epidermidicanis]|uniref:Penicillin-binding protein, beta-lactamase class C n=1 Tax=Corynebacterium epidermidicanis TaxID=1050174 RepID=A0A0G3GR95_9CORY|nr:serine hydrolase domain-containing protein [Corynebacterium epidermidicanis]AKK03614.1 penicillin-binding protein, beta-lactamase class C [Corynebacterium epidermidicanis]